MRVLMAAPFDVNGRYKGGISSLVNAVMERQDLLNDSCLDIVKFETCRIKRDNTHESSFNIKNIKNFFKIYNDLASEIVKNKVDCLYYHSSIGLALLKDLLAIKKAKRKTKIKTVLHIHFADYEKIMTGISCFDSLILKYIKKYIDRVVFLSNKTKQEFIEKGVSKEKCCVIYNFSTISFTDEEISEHLRSDMDKPQFLFVGSIDRRKGIFDALDCLKQLPNDFLVHICGGFNSADDEKAFNEYQQQLGDKMVFHGYVSKDEKNDVFLNSDVLLLPSYAEGLPVVILEAFSAACCVITTNVGAIPEIVENKAESIINAGNIDELKNAISFYLNYENYEEIRNKKQKNYIESKKYTIEKFVEAMNNVILN